MVWAASCSKQNQTRSTSTPDAGQGSPPDAGRSAVDAGLSAIVQLPSVIDLPYVVAGDGGPGTGTASSVRITVQNPGAEVDGLMWALTGSPELFLVQAPTSVPAHSNATVTIGYTGSITEDISEGVLSVAGANGFGLTSSKVYAVAGDPGLGSSTWTDVIGANNTRCGSGATVSMPTAPFPDPSASWADPSVRIFVPDGYRDRGSQDLVLHFHGFNTSLAATLDEHLYQEHVFASGSNAVLVVPEGPINAPSGNFGKLMDPVKTAKLLKEVLVVLYREGKLQSPVLGDVTLTSHSGGYEAVDANLGSPAVSVRQINLFDSVYGFVSDFDAFTRGGGLLRSDFTQNGGTVTDNQALAQQLGNEGQSISTENTMLALRNDEAVIFFADTTHELSTRIDGAYGEQLRWGLRHSRKGPRVELRMAVAQGGVATVSWLSPKDEDLTGFVVETSPDGQEWQTAAQVDDPNATLARFSFHGSARVRVRPKTAGVASSDWLSSDVYRIDEDGKVLVVNGFDRILGGSYGGLWHDFSAVVGEAVPDGVATVSHRALTEDGLDLSGWNTVIWLLGDNSVDDHTLSSAEQTLVQNYLNVGGHLLVSGSELGYDLGQTPEGASFLANVLGVVFSADDSNSYTVLGSGPLDSMPSFTYSGPTAPYFEDYPDAFTPAAGAQMVLEYQNGMGAAVGLPGKTVVVGFPLELIDQDSDRRSVVTSLLDFVETGG
jgi:hypothetical protein